MTNIGLQNIIFSDSERIVAAIGSGGPWEGWMQVELTCILRANGIQATREVPYPVPYNAQRLDILGQDGGGMYAIELKVESATNAGSALMVGLNEDRCKIAYYNQLNPGARWAVAIGYSSAALNAMQTFFNTPGSNSVFAINGGIGVLVATV